MARHQVKVEVPLLAIGKANVDFEVWSDGERIGRLLVSKGAIAWQGAYDQKTHSLSWPRFAALMRSSVKKRHGK